MIPTWMIKDIERRRRERERCEVPQLRIELPLTVDEGARRRPAPSGRVVIDPGDPDRRAPADPILLEYATGWQ